MIREFSEKFDMLENVLSYFPLPMACLNSMDEFVFINDAFNDLFGYTLVDLPDIESWFTAAFPGEDYRWKQIEAWSETKRGIKQSSVSQIPRQVVNVSCRDSSVRFVEMCGVHRDNHIFLLFMDVTERIIAEREHKHIVDEFKEILAGVKILGGILPICARCKKIKSDEGYWEQIEKYIRAHSDAEFSHGLCPECAKELYPELDL